MQSSSANPATEIALLTSDDISQILPVLTSVKYDVFAVSIRK